MMRLLSTKTLLFGGSALVVLALAAQAQTSPFAKKNKKQAWETQSSPTGSAPALRAPSSVPTAGTYQAPTASRTRSAAGASPTPPSTTASSGVPAYRPTRNSTPSPTYSASRGGSSVPPTGGSSVPPVSGSSYTATGTASYSPSGGGSPTPSLAGSSAPSAYPTTSYAAASAPEPFRPAAPYMGPSQSEIMAPDKVAPEFEFDPAPEELWPGRPSIPSRWALKKNNPIMAPNYRPPQKSRSDMRDPAPGAAPQTPYATYAANQTGSGSPVPPSGGTAYSGQAGGSDSPFAGNAQKAPAWAQPGQTPGGTSTPPTGYNPYAAPGSSVPPSVYNPNPQSGYYPGQNQPPTQPQARTWQDRTGLNTLATMIKGFLRIGAAATDRDSVRNPAAGWGGDAIIDGALSAEVSAITRGGMEYGVGGLLRGQYDKYRHGFGGRVGDCPTGVVHCADVPLAGGVRFPIRGHTSQFYQTGPEKIKEGKVALEGAYLFLRSAYGDVTVGRDTGAAYLFSLGAPTLLAVGPSNNGVDYTGLDAVKTVNDASGFAEKITYTSPRLLGDTVGIGVQFGASFAPDGYACGVDYCVEENGQDGTGVLSPDLENIVELGMALNRKFDNGLSVEGTVTYATGSEQSTLPVFDDLKTLGLGVEMGFRNAKLGGSYLKSNNGLTDGDYVAWDIGATWQPSKLGFTLGYGYGKDEVIGLTSGQTTAGVTYDFNDRYRLGAGVQHVNRDVNVATGGVVAGRSENATSVFIEGKFSF